MVFRSPCGFKSFQSWPADHNRSRCYLYTGPIGKLCAGSEARNKNETNETDTCSTLLAARHVWNDGLGPRSARAPRRSRGPPRRNCRQHRKALRRQRTRLGDVEQPVEALQGEGRSEIAARCACSRSSAGAEDASSGDRCCTAPTDSSTTGNRTDAGKGIDRAVAGVRPGHRGGGARGCIRRRAGSYPVGSIRSPHRSRSPG